MWILFIMISPNGFPKDTNITTQDFLSRESCIIAGNKTLGEVRESTSVYFNIKTWCTKK